MHINLPSISVVIRTKDEAPRLRLTLASLVEQKASYEVIVVNDGSVDETPLILAEAASVIPLKVVNHPVSKGRSAASNAGALEAQGDLLLFMDGDTLAGPGLLNAHARMHAFEESAVGRGEQYHLRCTRQFQDPTLGIPWDQYKALLGSRPISELTRMLVTVEQVRYEFEGIRKRAMPGIYPGIGPRTLHDIEVKTLREYPHSSVGWCAASGSNMSVRRNIFLHTGGYNEKIDINEHRELALRLVNLGARMRLVSDASTYHLTHRSGWRDPLKDLGWEVEFIKAHPIPAVALLSVFWGSLNSSTPVPADCRINSIIELENAIKTNKGLDFDMARVSLGLEPLGVNFWNQSRG